MTKLTAQELVSGSVSGLETALKESTYTCEELQEALDLEKSGSNRVTAIAALEDAIEDLSETEESTSGVLTPAKGKCITSKRGILSHGDTVDATALAGGEAALSALIESGVIVEL